MDLNRGAGQDRRAGCDDQVAAGRALFGAHLLADGAQRIDDRKGAGGVSSLRVVGFGEEI